MVTATKVVCGKRWNKKRLGPYKNHRVHVNKTTKKRNRVKLNHVNITFHFLTIKGWTDHEVLVLEVVEQKLGTTYELLGHL
jgi:hypothetical protein